MRIAPTGAHATGESALEDFEAAQVLARLAMLSHASDHRGAR